jgi:hypothetical protein
VGVKRTTCRIKSGPITDETSQVSVRDAPVVCIHCGTGDDRHVLVLPDLPLVEAVAAALKTNLGRGTGDASVRAAGDFEGGPVARRRIGVANLDLREAKGIPLVRRRER